MDEIEQLKEFELITDRKRILIDMDGVICDYVKMRDEKLEENSKQEFPQSQMYFWVFLEPIVGALEAYKRLEKNFDVRILSSPSFFNAASYTGKRLWVEKHIGLKACKKMILSYDKSIVKGDYLIDDFLYNGQDHFEGTLIEFPRERVTIHAWEGIVQKIEKENGIKDWSTPLMD
jgi:5'(3')-deoxyribonucleotidase